MAFSSGGSLFQPAQPAASTTGIFHVSYDFKFESTYQIIAIVRLAALLCIYIH